MARTQKFRAMAAATPLGPDALLLRSMTGREEIGRLFAYDLELLSEDHRVGFDAMLGQNVTVSVRSGQSDTAVRYFNGYVSRFVQLSALGRLAQYQATPAVVGDRDLGRCLRPEEYEEVLDEM